MQADPSEPPLTCPLCEAMCGLVRVEDGARLNPRERRRPLVARPPLPEGRDARPSARRPGPAAQAHGPRRRTERFARSTGQRPTTKWSACSGPCSTEHGPQALTVYVGNPVAHNLGLATYIGALVGMAGAAGMPAYYSPGTVDQWPLNVVSTLLFGGMWNTPIPDLSGPTI